MTTQNNPFLSDLFNQGPTPDDMLKAASAQVLEKLAEVEGEDLSNLTDEEVAALLDEIQNGEVDLGGEAAGDGEYTEEQVKEAEFQIEMADGAGRVMARSFHDEGVKLGFIQKQASEEVNPLDELALARAQQILAENGVESGDDPGEQASDGEWTQEDVEKVAAFASQVYGLDPQEMTDEQYVKVASLMIADDELLKEAAGSPSRALKMLAADAGGSGARVAKAEKGLSWLERMRQARAVNKGMSGGAGETAKAVGGRFKQLVTGGAHKQRTSKGLIESAKGKGPDASEARKVIGTRAGLAAGALGGVGAAGAAAMGKKASMLEHAVEGRAIEMLKEAGWDVE